MQGGSPLICCPLMCWLTGSKHLRNQNPKLAAVTQGSPAANLLSERVIFFSIIIFNHIPSHSSSCYQLHNELKNPECGLYKLFAEGECSFLLWCQFLQVIYIMKFLWRKAINTILFAKYLNFSREVISFLILRRYEINSPVVSKSQFSFIWSKMLLIKHLMSADILSSQ